jgi:TRAP-type uncharacterized transport system fused permease subunit
MISGSSIATTVTVGTLTIPSMMKVGYCKHFAAAVESTASIMAPVLIGQLAGRRLAAA